MNGTFQKVNEVNSNQPFHKLDEDSIVDKKLSGFTILPNQFAYVVDCRNNEIVEVAGSIKDLLGLKKIETISVLQERIHDKFVDKYVQETLRNFKFAYSHDAVMRMPLRNIFHSNFALKKRRNDVKPFMRHTFSLRSDKNGIFTHTGAIYSLLEGVKISSEPFRGHKIYGPDSLLFRNESIADFQAIFTQRELEILVLLSEGYKNRAIGEHLFISEKTVQTHRKNMLAKLEAKSTAHLVALAKDMYLI